MFYCFHFYLDVVFLIMYEMSSYTIILFHPHQEVDTMLFLTILIKWDRTCCSNRRQKLFGSRKDRCRLQRHRLHLQMNIWYDAPGEEVLIDSSKLKERPIILISKNNDPIAKWLDCRYKDRAITAKAITRRTIEI